MPVWTIKGGSRGQYEEYFLGEGFVALDYGLRRSIADFTDRDALRDHIENRVGADQMWRFYTEVHPGDMVVLPRKRTGEIAVGTVKGSYVYQPELSASHTRSVDWEIVDVPRSHFDQDLLNSFGSQLTLSQPGAPDTEARIRQIADVFMELETPTVDNRTVPPETVTITAVDESADSANQTEAEINLDQVIKERIVARFRRQYAGKELAYPVASILRAYGYHVLQTREGPDGGIDVRAGKGDLGFGKPRLCVQVKGRTTPVNLNEYSSLRGNITAFGAGHGPLVSLGGFTKPVHDRNEQQSFLAIRLWGPEDLAQRLLEKYDSLPQDIRADFRDAIPLDTVQALQRGESIL